MAWISPITTRPPSWPAISEAPRIGVRARRLKKPFSMSSASDWPEFIVANRAPWTKGTASAKVR